GGLAVARGLLARGWDVVVYEQATSFRPVGAGLTLAPNAVRALDWLGAGDELRERSAAHGALGIRTPSGRWLIHTPVEALESRFGAPSFALHRATLHEILARGIPQATIRTGHRVTAVRDGARPVVVFDGPDGPGEDEADVVVATDGIDGRARAALFPAHPGPAYAGSPAWPGVGAAEDAPTGSRDFGATETWGRGMRFGVVPLGDAAHAMTPDLGQGGCQALEDAVELCAALGRVGDVASRALPDIPSALAAYDRARLARTRRIMRASRRMGRLAQARNPIAAAVRNALVALTPPSAMLRASAEVLGWT